MRERRAAPGSLSERSLLAIFAHPDDESLACGGLLAWCAAEGARVTVLCLTRGEHGPRGGCVPDEAAPHALGSVRAGELHDACRALGVGAVTVLDYEDGMVPWADADRLEDDLLHVVGRLRPEVIVTFDDDGLYWHPDHIAVHERVTGAVAKLGAAGPALYYAQLPSGAVRTVVEHAALVAAGASGSQGTAALASAGMLGVLDPDAFGTQANAPTLVIDAGMYARRKLAALRCHVTQVAGGPLSAIDDDDSARLLGREQFRRAAVGRQGETFLDDLGRDPSGPSGTV